MTPILYNASETAYASNGIGRLSDTISCTVTEELNGTFELELEYPENGIHADNIREGYQIYTAYDETGDRQPFRVYRRTDTIDGVFAVLARHISSDLSKVPVMPFTASNIAQALQGLKLNSVVPNPFDFETDMTVSAVYAVTVPTSAKAILGSGDGSILGVFGGEVKYNNRTVTVVARRGSDTGVVVRYGKNMTGLEVVSEAASVYSAVVPFCKTQDGVVTCTPPIVQHGTGATEAVPLDLSDAFDYVPSPAQLESAALSWLNKYQPWIAEKAITVSFVELRDTTEYADFAPLERVVLGDGIKVRHTRLGVDADFRVVKTVYDALQDRYIEVMLGREVENIATMITEMMDKLSEARDIAQEIANGTYAGGTFINGSLIYSPNIYGGQIYIGQKQGGGYNFNVDGDGNVETNGNVHLLGADTRIISPLILSNAFSVFPTNATMQEIEALTPPSGFNLYGRAGSSGSGPLYNFLNIAQDQEYAVFSSPSGGYCIWDFGQTSFFHTVYYNGSGQSGTDAEIATIGDIPDTSEFVTAAEVQTMINDAIGGN